MTSDRIARVTALDLAEDGVLLARATCETCARTVLHGLGRDLNAVELGTRSVHCLCRVTEPGAFYTLTDPAGILAARLLVIREEVAERAAERDARRAARLTAQGSPS